MTVRVPPFFFVVYAGLVSNDRKFRNLLSEPFSLIILKLLIEQHDILLAQLAQVADEGFSRAKEEWEKNVLLWGMDLPRSLSPPLLLLFS